MLMKINFTTSYNTYKVLTVLNIFLDFFLSTDSPVRTEIDGIPVKNVRGPC